MCKGAKNVPYDPDGTGTVKEGNTQLIKSVVEKTAAFMAGGVKMKVEPENKRVIVYSNGCLDFCAVGIFDSLGIFKVTISSDAKHRVLIIIE